VVLLLAHDSILVPVDILVEEDTLAMADSLAAVHIPVVEEGIPVEDIPVVVHNLVEEGNLAAADTLEEASVALQSRIEAAHADLHLSHVLLLVVVQGMVVRMVVPDCSFATPSRVPDYP
jgi:hypothetical protein